MLKKIIYILTSIILSVSLYVFANTTFDIDEAFFTETWIGSGNYSPVHFGFSGNNSDAILFWWTGNTTGEVTLSGVTITCDKQIEWMYINTVRWNTVWPLDQNTLNELSGSSNFSGYENLTITGWFFTECTWTGVENDEIYGYIEHWYNGEIYQLWAWLDFDWSTWEPIDTFSGSLKLITGTNITAEWYILDSYGWTATVYSNAALNANIVWTWGNYELSWWNYYTRYTWLQVNIWSNESWDFELSGDLESVVNWTILTWEYSDQNIEIINTTWVKNINFWVSNSSGSFNKSISIVYDNEAPELNFTDDVDPGVNTGDTVIINYGDATVKKYKIVASGSICNVSIATLDYTGAIFVNTNIYNGMKVCVYAEDFLGNASSMISANTFNINNTTPTITITDNFSIIPVQTWTVSMTWANITGDIKFKIVNSWANCDNTWWEIYTGELI